MTTPAASGGDGMRLVLLDGHGEPHMFLNGLPVPSDDRRPLDGRLDAAER